MVSPAQCDAATINGVIYDPTLRQACQALFYASLDPVSRAQLLAIDLSATAVSQLGGSALPFRDTVDSPARSGAVFQATGGSSFGFRSFPGLGVSSDAAAILRGEGAQAMGFLDSFIGGLKTVGTTLLEGVAAIPTVAPVIIGAAQAIQATQQVLNGNTSGAAAAAMMSPQMAAAMMAASGGAATQGSAAQAAFADACRTDPACTAAIWQALQGGNVTPSMMNGSDISEAQLAAAGIPASLIMALRGGGQSALNTLRQLIPGLAVGAVGAAAGSALVEGIGGGSSKFPRSIFIADPRGGAREYKYRGRPVLYSGDIAAARRVVKVAKRARAARGSRRSQSRAAQILMLPAGASTACGKCGNGGCSGC
ncbi:MAG TPA: hypothetical protein VJP77_09955 [Planctomycetota bacterium]|nr:hypothetical protein [Planctomycetota bacterium]